MKKSFEWLEERLSEKSTWVAILGFIAIATKHSIDPVLADYITNAGLALTSIVAFCTKAQK